MNDRHDEGVQPKARALGRRDLIKLGTGAVATALTARRTAAQGRGGAAPAPGAMASADQLRPHTGPGYYTNDANRLAGNGPMDDNTAKIVKFVHGFNESSVTPSALEAANRTMVDSIAAIVAGFEEEPSRVGARLAKHVTPGKFKSTVFGYGVVTSPELASFANGCLIRCTDFNDNGPGGHTSDLIPAALALGEAMHATGSQVLTAVVLGYEISGAPIGGESVRAAMVAGKLLGLDEDRLANAVGIALIPHVALNKGVGALSMWKGVRTAEATKCGVWSALAAYEGMTGPPQPFEGRGSLWADSGPARPYTLPLGPKLGIEQTWAKRFPSDAQTQGVLFVMPEVRSWAKVDEIESIHWDISFGNWQEVGSNPKWDPRNRETADHSIPYVIARTFIDGDCYLDKFTPAKYPSRDPAVKALMDKITLSPVAGWGGLGVGRITVRKKNGETRYWDAYGGDRNPDLEVYRRLMSPQDLIDKFNKVCDYKQMSTAQRDKARATWGNLTAVKDIADPIRELATFGKPLPL